METAEPRYKVERELGRGAFGVVFLAYDNRLQRKVALKLMSIGEGLSDDEKKHLLDRFYREARAAAGLSHPNVVIIHDISKTRDRHFISMEFLEGEPLSELMSDKPMDPKRALQIADQALAGLEYAHAHGVIHRDIKPDNIFVMAGDHVKIVDFGLARIQTTSTITRSGTVMGSPGYIAPEVIEGNRVDERTDIFSFGVVLYEMLTGKRPFGPEGPFESFVKVIYRIVSEDPPPASQVNPELPSGIDEVLKRSLAKDPAARYQNAAELREALARVAGIELPAVREPAVAVVEKTADRDETFMREETTATIEMGEADAAALAGTGQDEVILTEIEEAPFEPVGAARKKRSWWKPAVAAAAVLAVLAGVAVLLLIVFSSSSEVVVPNLVNLSEKEARVEINKAGLKVGTVADKFAYDIWKGKVATQKPSSGTKVARGTTVDIEVSMGADVAAVPDVVGMPEAQAVEAVKNYGFTVKVERRFSPNVEEGFVFDTNPVAGTVKPRGEQVIIMVNAGQTQDGNQTPVLPDVSRPVPLPTISGPVRTPGH